VGYRTASIIVLLFVFQLVPVQSGLHQALSHSSSHFAIGEEGSQTSINNAKKTAFGNSDSEEVDISAEYSTEPAPMGIADYGIGPNGPYEYATNDSVGTITITSLSTNSTGNTKMTVQLNVNLAFTTNDGQYAYWMQDAAQIDTSSRLVDFIDNVWNASAPSANMTASGIMGNGEVIASNNKSLYVYNAAGQSLEGNNISLTYPTTITLNMSTGVRSGEPTVSFAYDDGFGMITYDRVNFTAANGLTSSSGFEVNGYNMNPRQLFYDSELVLGGYGSRSNTTDLQSDVRLQLEYWNGHNYEMVPNAYNYGSNTAEGMDNVLPRFLHYTENGTIFTEIQPGAGQLGKLYDESQIGIIDVTSPLTSGVLYVANTRNPTDTSQYPFINGEVTVTVYPGNYRLQLYQAGELYDEGNFTVHAGQETFLHTPFNGPQPPSTPLISAPAVDFHFIVLTAILAAIVVTAIVVIAKYRKSGGTSDNK
jgi:hypothetical protein